MPLPICAISAVVCTRNRGPQVVAAIESILANTHPAFELLVVDQSTDSQTAEAVAQFYANPRFRHLRSATQGLGVARNIGLAAARSPIVAFTDDDCTVPEDWLSVLAGIFEAHPRVTVAFCNVRAAEQNARDGYTPIYMREENRLIRSLWEKRHCHGIGAGMAVRRGAVLELGGFDEQLGAGARFHAAEDSDIAIRSLAKGHWVYETADVTVIHDGFRSIEQLPELSRQAWLGIGAVHAKLLRVGQREALAIVACAGIGQALAPPLRQLRRLRPPRGLKSLLYYASGFLSGLRSPMNRKNMLFLE